MRRIPLALLIPLVGSGAPAKRELPPYGVVYDQKELGRISFTCSFLDQRDSITLAATNKIRCDFTQALFTLPDASGLAATIAEAEKEFENGWQQQASRNAMVKGLRESCAKGLVKRISESEKWLSQNVHASALMPDFSRTRGDFQRLCACSNAICMHDELKAQQTAELKAQAETCTVFPTSWTTEFRRNGRTWQSVESNRGLCFASVTTTLFLATDSETEFWNMRTVQVPNADADPKYCPLEVQDAVDTWHDYGLITLNCRLLKL